MIIALLFPSPGIRQYSLDFIIFDLYPESTGAIAISGTSCYELFHLIQWGIQGDFTDLQCFIRYAFDENCVGNFSLTNIRHGIIIN